MKKHSTALLKPSEFWLILFGIWMLFLTGSFAKIIGTPGIIQAIRLDNLHQKKERQINELQDQIQGLQTEAEALEKNTYVQKREIRKVLGYTSKDEIVFDFSAPDARR